MYSRRKHHYLYVTFFNDSLTFALSLSSTDCFLLALHILISLIYNCGLYFILSSFPDQGTSLKKRQLVGFVIEIVVFVCFFYQFKVCHTEPVPPK